jgi:nitroreductase / dihydropteridine reductase
MEFKEALNWRYASKKMNGKVVPDDKLNNILDAISDSPSSAGLQPYKVFVISDHALKAKIHEQACPQPQIVEGSHLLVFAAETELTDKRVDDYIQLISTVRNVSTESLSPFADSIKGNILSRPAEQNTNWASRQAYIALGFGLIAAAVEQVDATPMEGFNGDALDKLLELKEKGLKSVVIMALGYRDEEKDFLARAKKVRRPKNELFVTLK